MKHTYFPTVILHLLFVLAVGLVIGAMVRWHAGTFDGWDLEQLVAGLMGMVAVGSEIKKRH